MKSFSSVRRQRAFSLVEVTLALGIASFCLVAVFGLLPVGVNTNRENIDQTAAAQLAVAIVADLRCTPVMSGAATTVSSPFYGIALAAPGAMAQTTAFFLRPDGSVSATAGTTATFRATVTVTPPASGRAASTARVWITWPGAADPDKGQSPAHYTGSSMLVVGLDRN